MKKILVTGGAGYIGSACVRELCAAGHTVVVFDSLRTGQEDKVDPRAKFVQGDVCSEQDLASVFSAYAFDAVIHCAALKAVGESEEKPLEYFETNVNGTRLLLAAMHAHNVPHLVFSSTAAVYKPNDTGVYTEESELGPLSVYGSTKHIAEILIQEAVRTKVIASAVILRYFNVAGDIGLLFKEKNPQNIFPLIAEALAGLRTLNVFGTDYPTRDGSCVRDYIHLADLVHAHMLAVEYVPTDNTALVCNLGTGTGTTVLELIAAFEVVSGKKIPATFAPRRAGDAATVTASAEKAREILVWWTRRTIVEAVASCVDTYKI
jgi:UDP-glucose 4-epimerase